VNLNSFNGEIKNRYRGRKRAPLVSTFRRNLTGTKSQRLASKTSEKNPSEREILLALNDLKVGEVISLTGGKNKK